MGEPEDEKIYGGIQQVPSVPQISQDGQLTEDDIFRMKKLSLSKHKLASELQSAMSVADSASNFEEHLPDNISNASGESEGMEIKKTTGQVYGGDFYGDIAYDEDDVASITQPPEMQLTEEDLLQMKKMTNAKNMLSSEMQSAISVADSGSNYEERTLDTSYLNTSYNENSFTDDSEIEEKNSDKYLQLSADGNFAFNRYRVDDPNLPDDVVTVLPFSKNWNTYVPTRLSAETYLNALDQAKVYLVGTAHFSHKSQQDVERVIKQTQPDIVFIELCSSRISILTMETEAILQEASRLNTERIMTMIRQDGISQTVLHVLLLQTSAYITKQLGMAPGGEFRAAYKESVKIKKCRVMLGDRLINVTFQRALAALGFFQKMRLFYHLLLSNWSKITPEDVERCKQRDLLEEVLREMAGEFPQLSEIFVKERDYYMINVLRELVLKATEEKFLAARDTGALFQPVNIVAVVGIGHAPGITENWVSTDIPSLDELLHIPPPSFASKVIGMTVRVAVYGAVAYGVYRAGFYAYNKIQAL